jgi:superfamily II DNA or RNA helicase
MEIREQLIRKGLNNWVKASFIGILNFATGVGKSYAALLAIEHFIKKYPDKTVLIVCPTNIVINNFKGEFIKFKKKSLLNNCKFVCYASIHKLKDKYSLVVFDEVHHLVTDKRLEFFRNCKMSGLLGLSASLTKTQLTILSTYKIKVVDEINIQQANELDLVSNFQIINLSVTLNNQELEDYNKLTSKIDFAKENYNTNSWKDISKRANLIYGAKSKYLVLPKIVELFKKEYGIIFSLTQKESDYITSLLGESCVSIHSGKTKKEQEVLEKSFKDGRTKIKIISTAKIFDEGVTLPRLSYGILVARYSKERQSIQNVGRVVRKDTPDKNSIIIRIYVKDTIEENWVLKSQKGFTNIINTNNYEELREEILKIRNTSI